MRRYLHDLSGRESQPEVVLHAGAFNYRRAAQRIIIAGAESEILFRGDFCRRPRCIPDRQVGDPTL